MRNFDKNPGTVADIQAGVRIAAASPTMCEVYEDFYAFADDLVRSMTIKVNHEAHTAGIALILRIVKPLTWGWKGLTGVFHI